MKSLRLLSIQNDRGDFVSPGGGPVCCTTQQLLKQLFLDTKSAVAPILNTKKTLLHLHIALLYCHCQ